MKYRVASSCNITGRGTAVFLEGDPPDLPIEIMTPYEIEVKAENGAIHRYSATKEYARKVPPGEVVALLVRDASPQDIPEGSLVQILSE